MNQHQGGIILNQESAIMKNKKGAATITRELETYRRPLFHPGAFERLIRSGLIAEGGWLDEEKTYDLTGRFETLMNVLAEARK